jgi:hypothetical protein
MNFLIDSNGPGSQDTTGNQRWQEEERQKCLQFQTRETDGGSHRKESQYIIHIENASESRPPFIVKEVKTATQLFQAICVLHPKFCHESILMRVSDTPAGSLHRVYYEKELPVHTDSLYIQLSLRKHTPMYGSKIEAQ